jgi:hypothetical protein
VKQEDFDGLTDAMLGPAAAMESVRNFVCGA